MVSVKENCEPSNIDWSQESTITVASAAKNGVPSAIEELAKRDKQFGL